MVKKSNTGKKQNIKSSEKKKNTTPLSSKKNTQKEKEKKLKKKLEEADEKVEYLNDRLLRIQAELDNFKKRTEREFSKIIKNANKELIFKILPVIDNLHRSLDTDHKKVDENDLRKGVELIFKNLIEILEEEGLESMKSVDEVFDVDKHDALMQVEMEGIDSGMVVEVYEKGYLLKGDVLRHAKVVVSK